MFTQAGGERTIALCIGMNGITWTREIRNATLERAMEVEGPATNVEHRGETRTNRTSLVFIPGRRDKRDQSRGNRVGCLLRNALKCDPGDLSAIRCHRRIRGTIAAAECSENELCIMVRDL